MEKEFMSYELSLKLKDLGFKEKCDATWRQDTEHEWYDPRKGEEITLGSNKIFLRTYLYLGKDDSYELCRAPLWQQAFNWFRINHNLSGEIYYFRKQWHIDIEDMEKDHNIFSTPNNQGYLTYEEAREKTIEKLIQIKEES